MRKVVTLGKANGGMEAIAAGTGNLGPIYRARDLDRAEEMLKKSLALFKAIGAAPSVKQVQTWLDTVNKLRAER